MAMIRPLCHNIERRPGGCMSMLPPPSKQRFGCRWMEQKTNTTSANHHTTVRLCSCSSPALLLLAHMPARPSQQRFGCRRMEQKTNTSSANHHTTVGLCNCSSPALLLLARMPARPSKQRFGCRQMEQTKNKTSTNHHTTVRMRRLLMYTPSDVCKGFSGRSQIGP